MMRVLFLTNVPSPYRVAFFNELGKLCDLTVLFEKRTSDERNDTWKNYRFDNFKGIFLKGKSISVDDGLCPEVVRYLQKDRYDHIVITSFTSPTGMIAIEWMRLLGMEYWLESDGGMPKDGKGFKERVKTHFIKGAKGYFSTAVTNDDYYLMYGAKREKIHRYPFTSLFERDVFREVTEASQKQALRQKLGIEEKHMVVSVGRFSYLNGYGKGYDALIRAAQQLPEDIGWYIVGGAPTEEFAKIVEDTGLKNIHFVDFMDKESLKEYYRAADVFALMTVGDVWGLVINESMACGLPVITTDKCVAGVELIEAGENGYIVKVGDDKALASRVKEILDTPGTVEAMGKYAIDVIRNYTIENMARIHMQVFEKN